jgi:aspartyl/asparaginyl-tRNA synthetase
MSDKSISSFNTIESYHNTVQKLRTFFLDRGFLEIDTQSRLSILAACEDPRTIATFDFAGTKWPLPQTGQMWLEHELLSNERLPGAFCLTTSYRNEPNPDPSRHLKIFQLFEFETRGDMEALQRLMEDLFEWLEFGPKDLYRAADYKFVADYYKSKFIEAPQEEKIWKDFSPVFFLRDFPLYTHPFWNMKKDGDYNKKIDAILYGVETIGSAERSCNVDEMRDLFHTISDGMYAKILYEHFGKERVEKELEEFLSYDFFPRFGGGIGVARLMRAMELAQQEQMGAYASVNMQRKMQTTCDF